MNNGSGNGGSRRGSRKDVYTRMMRGYENTGLVKAQDIPSPVSYEDLPSRDGHGVLIANYRGKDGRLKQLFSRKDNHVCVVAATRQGKTTSYVIPAIDSYAVQENRKSLVIADPKGEIYRSRAESLKAQGYKVLLLNFRDFTHSEFWNPLTAIYDRYMDYLNVFGSVELRRGPEEKRGLYYKDRLYTDQEELDRDLSHDSAIIMDDVEGMTDDFVTQMISVDDKEDPIWEEGSRDILKAILLGMLEDVTDKRNPVTRDMYNLDTVVNISLTFGEREHGPADGGYFDHRADSSRALKYAKQIILETCDRTRSSYLAVFTDKIREFRETTVRRITQTTTINFEDFTGEAPVALFIEFRDELPAHYKLIALFVSQLYTYLIQQSSGLERNMLRRGVMFILDEFGNMPPLERFGTVISTCAARNIWFTIILQSYSQLTSVYHEYSATILDNMNVTVFMGSNNPDTTKSFSDKCGKHTRISPVCALGGSKKEIGAVEYETIPVMPVSTLSALRPGECVITEINTGYVLLSRLEPCFMCKEYASAPEADEHSYASSVSAMDERFHYRVPNYLASRASWDGEDY